VARQASLLVADEIFFNLHGKAILHGIYNTDLIINADQMTIAQLIFYFSIETELSEPFLSLSAEVTLPGTDPVQQMVLVPPPQFVTAQARANPERSRWYTRYPLLISGPVLRPGRIGARVIHESGDIIVNAPWIVSSVATQPTKPN
jgi:hypothetical protein